ncbi:MAG TPA: hypothetical protein VNK04_18765 [Gemmataceae bacterium]|jgi:hypothetical protein|nr:hypothetical protein [Gemmataceae bacterium]
MPVETSLEQRIAALEAAVRALQRQLASGTPPSNWLEQIAGSFRDEPAFAEVLQYGREIRQADRPPEDSVP